MLRCGTFLLALAIMVAAPGIVAAQGTGAAPSQSDQPLLKPEQLDALAAPIALYPDALLANMLAASTYPLEVVEADRWVAARKKLKGDQLKAEVDKQSWDDSATTRQAGDRDRANRSQHDVRSLLRAGGGLWRLAVSGLSSLLFWRAALYRCRRHRRRDSLRRWFRAGPLGQLLARRMQLEQQQFLHQPHEQHWQQLAAQSGASPGREIQQCWHSAEVRK